MNDLQKNTDDDILEMEKAIAAEKMRRNDQKYLQQHRNQITHTQDERWTTNCRDSSGIRKKITRQTKEALEEEIIAFYKELERQATLTFPVICKEWIDKKLEYKEISEPTHTRYMVDYRRFFQGSTSTFCKTPLCSMTDCILRQFIKDSIVEFQLTKKSYKQLHILLRGALLYAKEKGYTDYSAGTFFYDLVLSDKLFAHKPKPAPETQFFNDQEASILMTFLWEEQDLRGLGLILMFQTGMRVGELAALRRESIKDGEIQITSTEQTYVDPESGRKVCTVVDHAKTDAGERTIILPDSAEQTIKAIRALNPFGEYLFMDKLGRIRAKRFNTWLHRACKMTGIPERSTHKIRRTYASILKNEGVNDKLITSQMGHTDISMTQAFYIYNRNSKADNRKAISEAINY